MFDDADWHGELWSRGRVCSAVQLEEVAELNDALASAIDLSWVLESGKLDGLPNGSERLIHQLHSGSISSAAVAFADPDSKG